MNHWHWQELSFCRRFPAESWQRIDHDGQGPSGVQGCWRSRGGSVGHPWKSQPPLLDIVVPNEQAITRQIQLVGVFGIGSDPLGTEGALLLATFDDGAILRVPLYSGEHFVDAESSTHRSLLPGDGTSIQTVGTVTLDGHDYRVDAISVDMPPNVRLKSLKLHHLNAVTSFVLLDAFASVQVVQSSCPFHSSSEGVSLSELASIVRVGDRFRFSKAVEKLDDSLRTIGEDLDEARGLVLTFTAIICAAKLEAGASRETHRYQLNAARVLEHCETIEEIREEANRLVHQAAADMLDPVSHHDGLIERALQKVERSFTNEICDADIAAQLGLSTSHFRFLFKEATGQPFYQYLLALRLERAMEFLKNDGTTVQEVAERVGFGSAAHFSRSFTKRFKVSPSSVRTASRGREPQ